MKLKLKWWGVDPEHCRIYYTAKVLGKIQYYCIQDNGKHSEEQWVIYRCSKDGEYSYPISLDTIESINLPSSTAGIVLDLILDRPFEHLMEGIKVGTSKYKCEYCKDTGEVATPDGWGFCICRYE